MSKRLKEQAPSRSVEEIGPGDYVKVRGRLERVVSNTAQGAEHTPRHWTVQTESGSYGMFDIARYAKSGDVE